MLFNYPIALNLLTINAEFLYNAGMSKIVKRILIAEDTPEWQKFHFSLLKNYDKVCLETRMTACAREAINLVQSSLDIPYDMILTDLQMESDFQPLMAGEWLVKELKSLPKYSSCPIVIVSAAYNISFIAHSLGVSYLSKRTLVTNPDAYYFMLDENLL